MIKSITKIIRHGFEPCYRDKISIPTLELEDRRSNVVADHIRQVVRDIPETDYEVTYTIDPEGEFVVDGNARKTSWPKIVIYGPTEKRAYCCFLPLEWLRGGSVRVTRTIKILD
jgi:hypothetical protein